MNAALQMEHTLANKTHTHTHAHLIVPVNRPWPHFRYPQVTLTVISVSITNKQIVSVWGVSSLRVKELTFLTALQQKYTTYRKEQVNYLPDLKPQLSQGPFIAWFKLSDQISHCIQLPSVWTLHLLCVYEWEYLGLLVYCLKYPPLSKRLFINLNKVK